MSPAIVTGGGSGIGLAIARECAALGASVAIGGRDEERLESAAAQLRADGAEVFASPVNIRDDEAVEVERRNARLLDPRRDLGDLAFLDQDVADSIEPGDRIDDPSSPDEQRFHARLPPTGTAPPCAPRRRWPPG